ncbi:hypothetical protein AAVH_30064 [Aphelenchoides avenae]|nr:hypothetical protein AAVH_30064 [Aphelenchus avenae]
MLRKAAAEFDALVDTLRAADIPLSRRHELRREWSNRLTQQRDELKASAAPTAEQAEENKALLTRAHKLRQTLERRVAEAEEQDNLIRLTEAVIQEATKTFEELKTKYKTPVPLDVSVSNSAILHDSLSRLANLDVHDVANKEKREKLGKRADSMRKDINAFVNDLDSSVRSEEALLAKRLELLQQLNAVGTDLLGLAQSENAEQISKTQVPTSNAT